VPPPGSKKMASLRIIGTQGQGASSSSAPWAQGDSHVDGQSGALGNVWGDSIGDSFGSGGLGLRGVGGRGEGFGLGSIGAGSGRGAPQVRLGAATVKGRLPPEIVQRVVRHHVGRYRACYDGALLRNPKTAGRVGVRFVIDKDGAVDSTGAAPGAKVSDKAMVSCLLRAFGSLRFPKPEGGGKVTVVYPIEFSPGAATKPPAKRLPSRRPAPGTGATPGVKPGASFRSTVHP
jgi:hypothetical protein